jgi:hypothetical protein
MILNDEASKTMDDYRLRMLISNKIPFILKCNMRKFDGRVKYYYEITSKQPMNRTYEKKKIGMNELNNIITSFLNVLDSSIEYLLNPNDFVLNPEYIYMNIETNQIYFCYMPGYEVDISKNFNELTIYILDKIDHDDKHAVATAYELYRQTLIDNYSLRDILNTIKSENEEKPIDKTEELMNKEKSSSEYKNFELKQEEEEKVKQNKYNIESINIYGGIVIATAVALLIYYISINIETIKKININSDLALKIAGGTLIVSVIIIYTLIKKFQMNKEEKDEDNFIIATDNQEEISSTKKMPNKKEIQNIDELYYTNKKFDINKKFESTLNNNLNLNNEAETYGNTVLLACKSINRKLIASKEKFNNFELFENSFLVGKMGDHVDGIIKDDMVSRIHAEIKNDGGKYFLTDLNSTNGTFHNERRLEANETVEIQPEDFIRFATAEYVFR